MSLLCGKPCHRNVTHSRNQEDTEGHQRTRRLVKLSTGGHARKRADTRGHEIRPVRDREAPGVNAGLKLPSFRRSQIPHLRTDSAASPV
jgi:hypothetical protein